MFQAETFLIMIWFFQIQFGFTQIAFKTITTIREFQEKCQYFFLHTDSATLSLRSLLSEHAELREQGRVFLKNS